MNSRFDRIAPGVAAKWSLFIDLALVVVAILFTSAPPAEATSNELGVLVTTGLLGWFIAAATLRLYSPYTPRNLLDGVLLTWLAAFAVATGLVVMQELTDAPPVLSGINFGLMLAAGATLNHLLITRNLEQYDEQEERILIIGTGPLGVVTYEHLSSVARRQVVGFLRFDAEPDTVNGSGVPVLGDYTRILDVLSELAPTEVYVAGRVIRQGHQMQQVVQICEQVGIPFAVPLHSLQLQRATLMSSARGRDGYLHYMNAKPAPLQYGVKRLVDIVASTAALVMLSPLLLGVALIIKLTSEGPILFRQARVGLHGREFGLLKFRSMVVNAEELKAKLAEQNEQSGPVFKMKNDPRITPIGRFIRKYSIDELPQLVNILRGDMTIVGPRPALASEVKLYKPWQRRRLSVRPGLTCYWQVGGRNEIGFDDWMRLDLRYVDNWSLAVDAQLILQTFPVVLTGRGAS